MLILQVALDTPLRRVFDYLSPEPVPPVPLEPGTRVRVPFGRRKVVGILLAIKSESDVAPAKLRRALEILDERPVFDPASFAMLTWAADYYHHPVGEVFAAALPTSLRRGEPAFATERWWRATAAGHAASQSQTRRAPGQQALLSWLAQRGTATRAEISHAFKSAHLRTLSQKGWIEAGQTLVQQPSDGFEAEPAELPLTQAQSSCVAAIAAAAGSFSVHLLYGVTGSGKTEVYLRAIAARLTGAVHTGAVHTGAVHTGDAQALVLVPEIALTPQLVARFRSRFSSGVVVLHSGLTETERRDTWRAAHSGAARIVIGTRSAVFTSMPRLALVVVDEEHDASYKQHEGFHYSARDLAIVRARATGIPIILGSATPSFESLENAAAGRYIKHVLPQRPGAAQQPRMSLVDLRKHAADQGLSTPVMLAIGQHLQAGGQVIVFLNRRGYAPSLFCNACGWIAPCAHCDARMTLHRRAGQLRCHHCGAQAPIPASCGTCGQALLPVGQGTERVEETLLRLFPDVALARLDRDTAAGRGAITSVLERVHSGEARILVGTQMLTKGHHFPDVTLVVVLDADQGLFASDFRATERLAQTITQVAGRAGREMRPGEVMIQTAFPEHPLLNLLIAEGYESFAQSALLERREADWPPYSRLALLRAEARSDPALTGFLVAAAGRAHDLFDTAVQVLGPASAVLARRADHFRAHLLLQSATRPALQRFLAAWLPLVEQLPQPSGLRWSIDVDPLEVD